MTDQSFIQPPPWGGQPYSVKRHGVTIANCDSEPVQTPGCIQAHGALLVFRPADFTILQASENTGRLLGCPPEEWLGHRISLVLGSDFEARLAGFLARELTERNPLYFLTLPSLDESPPLDATVQTIDGVGLIEFEATRRREGQFEPDYYAMVKKTVIRFQDAPNLQQFCDSVTAEVHALTGFDRVMIYKFHEDGHGEVVAESKLDDLPPWLGLHYPADDIPKPVRHIFTKTWLRPVPDVSGDLAELVPLVNPDTGKPLDLTYCALRGVSVMYTEYLKNMGVTACMTMPIRRGQELWGLIACHHYSGPKHVSYQVRTACEFLAQVVSLQHKAAEDREQLVYRLQLGGIHQQLAAAAAQKGGLSALTDGSPTLLDGMDAGGAAVFHRERWWRIGDTPDDRELDRLGEWLNARPELASATHPLYVTDSLARDYPPGAAFAGVASGLLAVPLSRNGLNLMLWFRPETIQTLDWAGSPHDKPMVEGPHGPRLTPRRSFELFRESVQGQSMPWKPVELEAASRLRLLLMELVVSRAEHLADLNADLARSNEEVEAFVHVASHDLKEPLRDIYKYAHQLLEEETVLNEEHREKLAGLMRLTKRMESLLDALLHFSRVGRVTPTLEMVDLNEVLDDATELVGGETVGDGRVIQIPRRLPVLWCDRVRMTEVFANLLSNAIKYCDRPDKRVEVGFIGPDENTNRPERPAAAAGHLILYVRDNGIGIHPRNFDQVFELFKRLHGRSEYGGGTGAGLSIVRKIVERRGGRIWVESTPGVGSTFYFTAGAERPA